MKATYHGSCHCGAVRYEADVDLEAGTGRCNCSYCAKTRSWGTLVKPEDFRLLAGEDVLSDYGFGSMAGHHRFCGRCGVHTHGHGYVEELGGEFASIHISSLDDVPPAQLGSLPIAFQNGRDNLWWEEPEVKSYL